MFFIIFFFTLLTLYVCFLVNFFRRINDPTLCLGGLELGSGGRQYDDEGSSSVRRTPLVVQKTGDIGLVAVPKAVMDSGRRVEPDTGPT